MRGDLVTEQTDNGFTQDPIACLMSALTKPDLTARNEIATGLDQFLLRHLGFFNVEPASRGYMIRLRLPARCVAIRCRRWLRLPTPMAQAMPM
ncbi:hypothetical protein [Ascidiaceihabitans sp.]|uniref:hypothetical protein n=1 Tax=Ascidiaceihabitans sp. TaxID=1872644 RepID=UPI0032975014